jgi:pyruvate formate lyase activating enzyme
VKALHEARFYKKIGNNQVMCHLCSHRCTINDTKRGICGVRENQKGVLYTLVYGKVISESVDPIEKKPLFHFYPGSTAYSIATMGCNFRCDNCQNWEISQLPKPKNPVIGQDTPPIEIVKRAKRRGCKSIAYTYTEPVIFMEYAYDIAKNAIQAGIKNVLVTNGYITKEALLDVAPYFHAANIDLKSFSNDFYIKNCGARLNPVLEAIKLHKKLGIWIEITTLIIPDLNDQEDTFRDIAQFIKSVGEEIPWHISRFYPSFQLIDRPPTPIKTLQTAKKIGQEIGLKHIYIGNVPGEDENTYCRNCTKLLIERHGYNVTGNKIVNSKCSKCGLEIKGTWK